MESSRHIVSVKAVGPASEGHHYTHTHTQVDPGDISEGMKCPIKPAIKPPPPYSVR